jgi:hypothetical protein
MKIGEYRTNGQAVVWMWTEFVALFWKDEHTSSSEIHLTPASHDAFNQWRLMTIVEATAWCHGAKAIPPGIPADDWQGMYHVAAKWAQEWEDKAKALQAELDNLKRGGK